MYCYKPNHTQIECRNRKSDVQHGGPRPYVSGTGYTPRVQRSDRVDSSKSREYKSRPKVAAVSTEQGKEESKKDAAKSDSKKTCLIFKEDRNELLFVPFNSRTLKIGALVDTGADISIISQECLANVKIIRERRIELDVQVASSSTIKVNKEVGD